MNTKKLTQEQISALADGELSEEHIDMVLAALRRHDEKADWDIYHQIGDMLRSDDMDVKMSADFAARFSARLEAEPAILAPTEVMAKPSQVNAPVVKVKRWALPSMAAAAAMAAVAFFATPQLMVAMTGSGEKAASLPADEASVLLQGGVIAASAPEGVVLRDPRIDDYLMAHQRISPSVYGTAQFARSANFATDSNK